MAQHHRYLVVDVDSLLASVKRHMEEQPLEFSSQQQAISTDDLAIDPQMFTAMLTDATSFVKCRTGTFYQLQVATGNALRAIGWQMKEKCEPSHRALENLLSQMSKAGGACPRFESKTLVLATGNVKPSVASSLEVFLRANWCVQLYFLQRCQDVSVRELLREFPDKLELVYIDHYVQSLVVHKQELQVAPAAPAPLGTFYTPQDIPLRPSPAAAPVPPATLAPAPATSWRVSNPNQSRQQQVEGVQSQVAPWRPSHMRPAAPRWGPPDVQFNSWSPGASQLTRANAQAEPGGRALADLLVREAPSQVHGSVTTSHELLRLETRLQEIQDAMLAIRMDDVQRSNLNRQNAALLDKIRAQEQALEAERAANEARVAQREADALVAQRLALQDREEYLTCPITHELFERPVTMSCCGKTFSESAMQQLRLVRDLLCPWCRSNSYTTPVNHDLVKVVELFKQQRAALQE